MLLAAVLGAVELDGDLPADELLEVGRAAQLPLGSRGGHLEDVALVDGVGLVERLVERARDELALVYRDAFVVVDIDAEIALPALFYEFDVP